MRLFLGTRQLIVSFFAVVTFLKKLIWLGSTVGSFITSLLIVLLSNDYLGFAELITRRPARRRRVKLGIFLSGVVNRVIFCVLMILVGCTSLVRVSLSFIFVKAVVLVFLV